MPYCYYIIVTYSRPFCPQPEPDLAAILERLKSLERKQQPTVDSIKRDIVQYALRQSTDFDKHLAIEKIEYLKHVARDLKDKKADYYSSVHSILLERINKNGDQFKTYVLALLGDRDYERIIEAVNKVDKTFNKMTNPSTHNPALAPRIPTPVPAVPGVPQMQSFSFPSVPSPYFQPQFSPSGSPIYTPRPNSRRPFCSFCNIPGHSFARCFRRRSTGPFYQNRPFGKNM